MKKRRMRLLQANNKALMHVLVFSLMLSSSLFFMFHIYEKFYFIPLRIMQAELIVLLLHAKNIGTLIEIPYANLYVDITKECSGFKTFAFMFSLFLATPHLNIQKKMFWMLMSFPISIALNITRILIAIVLASLTQPSFYSIYDSFLLASLNSIAILAIWYFSVLKD